MLDRADGGPAGFPALYFNGSSHGSPLTLGGMICGWPSAEYPSNASEESQSLDKIRKTMSKFKGDGKPIAAIVIEPT